MVRTRNPRSGKLYKWFTWLACMLGAMSLAACGGQPDSSSSRIARTAAAVVVANGASVTGLTKISETRVSRTVFDYVFRVTVVNNGSPLTNAEASVTSAGTGTTIINGKILIGNLPSGSSVSPTDTITLRHDRTYPFNAALLGWQVTGTPGTSNPSASAMIGQNGGVVSIAGGASVTIPPGALASPVTITVTEISNPGPTLPSGGKQVGKTYSFEPHGLVFAAPVTLTLPYETALLDSTMTEGDIVVGVQLPDGSFEVTGDSSTDPEAESAGQSLNVPQKMVSINVSSFSVYGAIAARATSQFTATVQSLPGASVEIYQPTTGGMRKGYSLYPKTCTHFVNGVAIKDDSQVTLPSRTDDKIKTIVLHSTNSGNEGQSFNADLSWATSKCNATFAHYYIDRTGYIYQLVEDLNVAQHAAPHNTDSIGIELFNNVGEPYDGRQIAALIRLVDFLTVKHKNIALPSRDAATGVLMRHPATDSIITHHDVSVNAGVNPPKCDPAGTFRSSSELVAVSKGPKCIDPVPLGTQRTPNVIGGSSTPALVDVVIDAVIAMTRTVNDTGVINTSGGDSNAAGTGGPINFIESTKLPASLLPSGQLTQHSQNNLLFVADGTTYQLGAGAAHFTDVIIAGTLIINGSVNMSVTGSFYLAPSGRILVNATNMLDGGSLNVQMLGTPVLQGLIDATGKHGLGGPRGGDGGQIEFHSAAFQSLLVPTLITRGGNATSSAVPYTGTGGSGGNITINGGSAHVFVGGGNGPAFSIGPAFRANITETALPPFYIGAELPPPPPFNVTSGGITPVAGQRTPLRKIPTQTGFTRGLLTSGGMGAFGDPAGAGGSGGHIIISGTGMLTLRDVDLITGADIETVRGGVFLQDGIQHFYYAASGSLGGKATTAATIKDGGPGGAAGNITVQGVNLYPTPATAVVLSHINGFGQPSGPAIPHTTDVPLSSVFWIGDTREISSANGTKLYRLRIDSLGNGLAGGSGGMPGGSPFVLFPGRFGQQGASGVLNGLPK